MATMDPGDVANAAQAGNSLIDHGEVFMRTGIIAFIAGAFGSFFAFLSDSRRHHIPFGWKLILYYFSKLGTACLAAYIALLVVPMFGLGTSVQAEQVVALLAAVGGADFIGLWMRRILGTRQDDPLWDGAERRRDMQ